MLIQNHQKRSFFHHQSLADAMTVNTSVQWLDMRETDIPEAHMSKINKCLHRNQEGEDYYENSISTDQESEVMELQMTTAEPHAQFEITRDTSAIDDGDNVVND